MRIPLRILCVLVALALSALCFSGSLYPRDGTGRILVGSVWVLVAVFWAFGLVEVRNRRSAGKKR